MNKRMGASSLMSALLTLPVLAFAQGAVITDGDTFSMNGVKYRLNGIDAPEVGQRCGKNRQGSEATARLAELIEGRHPRCEVHGQDDYDREIATCYLGDLNINAEMVRQGYAWAFVRFSKAYLPEQKEAQAQKRGIWSHRCDPQAPWDYRTEKWEAAAQQAPEGCPIKGNISANGRIYHAPWSPWYSRTRINTSKGERWFCSEREALDAGWRAPIWK